MERRAAAPSWKYRQLVLPLHRVEAIPQRIDHVPSVVQAAAAEDTRAYSDKVFSRVGQSVATVAVMVRKTPMIAGRQRQQSIVFTTEGLRPAEAILNCRIPG